MAPDARTVIEPRLGSTVILPVASAKSHQKGERFVARDETIVLSIVTEDELHLPHPRFCLAPPSNPARHRARSAQTSHPQISAVSGVVCVLSSRPSGALAAAWRMSTGCSCVRCYLLLSLVAPAPTPPTRTSHEEAASACWGGCGGGAHTSSKLEFHSEALP